MVRCVISTPAAAAAGMRSRHKHLQRLHMVVRGFNAGAGRLLSPLWRRQKDPSSAKQFNERFEHLSGR